ncbi:MAG: hypothetical protein M3044_12755 [Thermoproteota archaeon]|nr:hypothetical protein [Thermoproteota archaeon]
MTRNKIIGIVVSVVVVMVALTMVHIAYAQTTYSNATETITSGFKAGIAAQNLNYQESHSGVANNITVGNNATCPPHVPELWCSGYIAGYTEEWAWIYWHLKLP